MSATGAAAAFNNYSTALAAYLDADPALKRHAKRVLEEQGEVLVQFRLLSSTQLTGLLAGADFAWGSDPAARLRAFAQLHSLADAIVETYDEPRPPQELRW